MLQLKEWIYKHKIILILAVILTVLLSWNFIHSFSETVSDNSWDGVVATEFSSGNGTRDNPYVITSASEYGYFKELLEGSDASLYLDKYYVITDSFNYGNYSISINNILPFTGTLDGTGHSIYGATLNNSLFNELDGATIKNIKYSLNITSDKTSGILSNSINDTKLSYFILDGSINGNNSDITVSGIGNTISNSEIENIVINVDANSSNYVSISNNISSTTINNVLVRTGYNHLSFDSEYEVDEFSINNGNVIVSGLDKYASEDYKIVINNNSFYVSSSEIVLEPENESGLSKNLTSLKGLRSASITVHDSGIVTADHAIYINDLTSDYNYYMGLNYTKITNTNGTIPTGTNQNLYSNSNLATVYIRYSSADINDSSMYGSVSVSEDIRDYYYYKRYPVVNGYITFDLIDSPWANRPTDMAFNGWVTDYDGATISLDMDTYVRSVKIPVSDISNPISITFYSSWTIASVVTTTTFTNLKSVGMNALTPSYGDLTIYYVTARVNNNSNYPNSNDLYDLNGNHITSGSRCRTSGGCTYLTRNTNNTYNANTSYYSVTPNGNGPATVTRVYPQQKPIPYYDGGSAAGYFIRVTSGTENIYSSTGVKQDSCSGTCYKLLQYSDGNITSGTTYYYLTTRDTNIFAPTSTNNITANNISSTKPMTITGIHNGTDNSNSRTLRMTDDWEIAADIRIEFIRFYVSDTTTNVSEFDSDGYEIIGNFKNVKLGRGLKRNGSNLTANSFVGGSSSSATTLSKYTFIVESGFYQTGSAVGYGSAVTHRVLANVILGSDYDRISSNGNNNLIVYYAYAGSWGSNLYNSSNSSNSYDTPAIYTVVKSGSFGTNKADYAAGIYVGGRSRGTHYSLREALVECGYIYNLIGGPSSDDGRASKNDIIINVKGGEIDLVFGGAGASDTVGNKILNITGGTINYSIVGGSNAAEYSSSTSNPNGKIDGDTLLYVGGNVTVGTKNDKLFTISSGDVYGAGNGRVNEPTIGAVNNSTVIIGPTATIRGSVYGGGNNGAVGGNTTGSATGGSGSTVTSGVYEDETTDNSIRYYGPSPDNYIQFNGELYRIVGLFNNVSTASGSKNLVRIVKNTSLGNRAWGDANMTTVETNTSTETTSGYFANNTYNYTNYYKNYYNFYVKNDNTTSNMYNYLNTTYYNGLNSTYKNYIEEVNWNLGATTNTNQNTSAFYTAERSNGVVNYLTGINQTGNGNSLYSSSFKVGLFYPSDYGYANNDSSCLSSSLGSYSATCRNNNWMSGMTNAWTMTSSTDVTNVTRTYQVSQSGNWFNGYTYTMNRYYHVSNRNFVIGTGGLELKDIYYTGNDNDANNYYNTGAVYPSFYLKEDVTISGGSGKASDPYIIGSSNDTLIDIIDEIMHPSEPTEPPVITHDESEYMAKTRIEILGGSISGSVYGAGNKNGAGNANNNRLALAKVNINMSGGSVSESIYGGANAEGTVYGDVFINVIDGTVSGNVYGGGKGGPDSESDGTYVTDNVNVTIGSNATNNLRINGSVYGGSAFGTVNASSNTATDSDYATNVTVNAGVITGSVFGGGEGDANHTPYVIGNINVTINGGNITNVFGGNDQAGSHTKLNKVELAGGTIGSVYGGGNKSSVTNTHVYLDGATVTNLYGGSNTLGNVSTTDVKIRSGSVGNVYGGNNEGGTCGVTNVLVEGSATVSSSLYGGGNQVSTTTTNVLLNSAGSTIPNVYGGGNSASVTTANVTKGNVNVTNLFGGSNSSGTVGESHITSSSGTATNIYGGNNAGGSTIDTYIIFNGGSATNIYGGGNNASSDVSNITVNNGTIGTIFGGGNNAGLTTSNIHMVTGNVTTIYGGSNNTGTVTTTNVQIDNTASTVSNVYGGGNSAPVGTTNVTITAGTFGNIFGGGNLAQVTGNTTLDINGETINTNIYGGGNFGVVKGSSTVTITNATILGSAYAGGNGSTATLEGNTSITIDGNTTIGSVNSVAPTSGCVFGGGNQAVTGTETDNDSISTVNIVGGHIYGNVYGGANTSKIYGNTVVNIGQSAYTSNTLTKTDIHVHGHIFGGGEANASGSEIYDWSYISVTEGVNITIDADTYNNFLIDGSFYGGGNASSASGDSYLIIRNYGEREDPKDNISIQRVTYVTIDNSSILLRGAVDRANEYSNELFAISRVENLKLKNNSELYLVRGGNLLEEFESLDSNGNIASVTIDTENNTVTKTVDNRVYMYEGRNLNIAHDQQVTDYGEVHGMSFFGIFNFDNNGHVNPGIYSSDYDPGDTLPWEGTFGRGSYVLGAHVTNHNIKVDGFYSHFMDEETQENKVDYIDPTPKTGQFYMWYIGENVIEYNVNLTASKYSTLGALEVPFLDFSAPNTSFQIIGFDSSEIASGISLVDKNTIPRIAPNVNDANTKFGLAMEASNTGWLTTGKTTFYTREPGYEGITYYEGENSDVAPTLLFYLYHSKNISIAQDLGTVRISVMAITKINALSNQVRRLIINVNMSTLLATTMDYEGAMTPGDKYDLFTSTSNNITTKSKFSVYYSLYAAGTNVYRNGYHRALSSSYILPVGTKITMLDFINGVPEYYYHVITAADVSAATAEYQLESECSYNLSLFTKMGSRSNNSNYDDASKNAIYYNGTDSYEEFIFIVDFSDTNINGNHLGNSLLMEMRDANDESIISVLGQQQSQLVYNLYDGLDSTISVSIDPSLDPLYIGYNDILEMSIDYSAQTLSGVTITDTQYFDSKLGAQIYLVDSHNNVVSGTSLTGAYFELNGVRYYPDIDGYTHIKLADKVGNTKKWVIFNTENANIPTGEYTFMFEFFASPDGIYYSSGNPVYYDLDIEIINTTYGLNPQINENSIIFSANNDKDLSMTIAYTSLLNNPNIRLSMYRRKYDTVYDTNYEQVDFLDYINGTFNEGNLYEYIILGSPQSTNTLLFDMKDELLTGTYRLSFRLYDGDTQIGEVIRYIIVK